jgi:hypothetical protein
MLKSDQKNWYGGFWSEFDQYTDRTAYQIPFKFSYQIHIRSWSVCLVGLAVRRLWGRSYSAKTWSRLPTNTRLRRVDEPAIALEALGFTFIYGQNYSQAYKQDWESFQAYGPSTQEGPYIIVYWITVDKNKFTVITLVWLINGQNNSQVQTYF